MTIDYTHVLFFDPLIYGRKQSDSAPSLVHGVEMPQSSQRWCEVFWSGTATAEGNT